MNKQLALKTINKRLLVLKEELRAKEVRECYAITAATNIGAGCFTTQLCK